MIRQAEQKIISESSKELFVSQVLKVCFMETELSVFAVMFLA